MGSKSYKPFSYEKSGLPKNDGLLKKAFDKAKRDAAGSLDIFFDSILPLAQMMNKSTLPENRRQAALIALLFPCWQEEKQKRSGFDFAGEFGDAVVADLKKLGDIYDAEKIAEDDVSSLSVPARAVLCGSVLAVIEQDRHVIKSQETPEKWEWMADIATKFRALMPSDPQIDSLGAQLLEMTAEKLNVNFHFYFSPDGKLSFDSTPPPECVTTAKKSWVPN